MHDVLIFDSGLGGLSVASELQRQMPQLSMLYLSDYAGFPYGLKTEPWLIARVETVLRKVLGKWPVKMLVVACNTASTVTLPTLREKFPIPIVGVVPAIKPAAQVSRLKSLALLATPATINRAYTENLIREFAFDCQLIRVGSSRLVEIAEEKLQGRAPDHQELLSILKPLFLDGKENVDTVVLACTHFPLLRAELAACMSKEVQWVDSGEAIARRVQTLMNDESTQSDQNLALITASSRSLPEINRAFAKFGFSRVELVDS